MAQFVAIDVETANADMSSICQIGIARFEDGTFTEGRSWLVDPEDWFDEVNVSIHGINERDVRGAPTFGQLHQQLAELTSGAVVVCHTHFDRVALAQACARYTTPALSCTWLDSARVARRAWPDVAQSGYGLAPLCQRLGIEFKHHDAAEDARAAGHILLHAIAATGLSIDQWLVRVEQSIIDTSRESLRRSGHDEGVLSGESICFTGQLVMPRRQAADRAQTLGAAVEPGVTKHTTLLVVGDQDITKLGGKTKSSKHLKAEGLIAKGQRLRILSERDFLAFRSSEA